METLLEKGERERDDTSAKECSSEGHRLPPDCSSSGETTDQERVDTQRQKKPRQNQTESGKCVFVRLYRDETEEEKGILKAQLCCFDGATCGLAEGLDIYIKKLATLINLIEETAIKKSECGSFFMLCNS